MKKEIFNILILSAVAIAVAWLYWPEDQHFNEPGANNLENYILALSWQPAFCETRPNKAECRSQHERRYDASNFSLHGVWPQPRDNVYCGVPKSIINDDKRGQWHKLPKLEIQGRLRKELSRIMPGYRSNLHRHEWYKHGTCFGKSNSPQLYYEVSIKLVRQLNKTPLRDLFSKNIGKEITAEQIIKAFERSEGRSARHRINISCKRDGNRTLINELKISYALPETDAVDFEQLKEQAPKLSIGCKRGIIDPVGLQ